MKFATNPLPGMNPWLEAYWGDIHTRLTTYSCDAIQRQLPPDLQARVEEYLSVCEPDEESRKLRRISPDVQIIEQPGIAKSTDGGLAVAEMVADEPLRVRRRSPPQTLRYIQIVDLKANRRVVTAIEFLSLANKATAAGRKQYLAKQSEFIVRSKHFGLLFVQSCIGSKGRGGLQSPQLPCFAFGGGLDANHVACTEPIAVRLWNSCQYQPIRVFVDALWTQTDSCLRWCTKRFRIRCQNVQFFCKQRGAQPDEC